MRAATGSGPHGHPNHAPEATRRGRYSGAPLPLCSVAPLLRCSAAPPLGAASPPPLAWHCHLHLRSMPRYVVLLSPVAPPRLCGHLRAMLRSAAFPCAAEQHVGPRLTGLGAPCQYSRRPGDMVQGREPGQGVRHAACPSHGSRGCSCVFLPMPGMHASTAVTCPSLPGRCAVNSTSVTSGTASPMVAVVLVVLMALPDGRGTRRRPYVVVFLNTRHSKDPRRDPRSRLNTRIRHTR
jgi:hypothetical protein